MTTYATLTRTVALRRLANYRAGSAARSPATRDRNANPTDRGFVSGLAIAAPVAAIFWIAALLHFL